MTALAGSRSGTGGIATRLAPSRREPVRVRPPVRVPVEPDGPVPVRAAVVGPVPPVALPPGVAVAVPPPAVAVAVEPAGALCPHSSQYPSLAYVPEQPDR
jgi:hypothetical protein